MTTPTAGSVVVSGMQHGHTAEASLVAVTAAHFFVQQQSRHTVLVLHLGTMDVPAAPTPEQRIATLHEYAGLRVVFSSEQTAAVEHQSGCCGSTVAR